MSVQLPIIFNCNVDVEFIMINQIKSNIQLPSNSPNLHVFSISYKQHLLNLNMLPLMHHLDFYDICFFINALKNPIAAFNVFGYVLFITSSTKSSSRNKLRNIFSPCKKLHKEFLFQKITQTLKLFVLIVVTLAEVYGPLINFS